MIDRLVSGAGAVAALAERAVRRVLSGAGAARTSPFLAGLLVIGAGALLVAGIEAIENPTPRVIGPAAIAATDDLGRRSYATVEGELAGGYVETYTDENGNGEQDTDETGESWFYFLVDGETQTGVTVRTETRPDHLAPLTYTGELVRDPEFIEPDLPTLTEAFELRDGLIEPQLLIDAITEPSGTSEPFVFGAPLVEGRTVTITAPMVAPGGYVWWCEHEPADGDCGVEEADGFDILLYDSATDSAIIVAAAERPPLPMTFTGMLRRQSSAVTDATTAKGLDFARLGVAVSDTYVLEDRAKPASATLTIVLAFAALIVAGILLIGWAGGYLVYRGGELLPSAARTLQSGERLPLRVTGVLVAGDGPVRVREARAELARIVLPAPPVEAGPTVAGPSGVAGLSGEAGPMTDSGPPDAPPAEPPQLPASPRPSGPSEPPGLPTTLIVERADGRAGIAVGRGELTRVWAGRVLPFRGPRPAIRAMAGTGQLLLSFDTVAERNRAAAELLDEGGPEVRGHTRSG